MDGFRDDVSNGFKDVTKVLKEIQTTLHEFINEVKVKPTTNKQEPQEQQEKDQTQLTNTDVVDKSTNKLADLKASLLSDCQHKRQQMIVNQSESDKLGEQVKLLIEKQDYHDELYATLAYETRQLQAMISMLDEKENKAKESESKESESKVLEKTQTEPLQTQPLQTEPLQTQPLQTEPLQTQPLQERNIVVPEHTLYRFGVAATNGVDVKWPELLIYKSHVHNTLNKAVEELPVPRGVKDMYLDTYYDQYSSEDDPLFLRYSGDDGTVYGICKVVIKKPGDNAKKYYIMCYGVKIR